METDGSLEKALQSCQGIKESRRSIVAPDRWNACRLLNAEVTCAVIDKASGGLGWRMADGREVPLHAEFAAPVTLPVSAHPCNHQGPAPELNSTSDSALPLPRFWAQQNDNSSCMMTSVLTSHGNSPVSHGSARVVTRRAAPPAFDEGW